MILLALSIYIPIGGLIWLANLRTLRRIEFLHQEHVARLEKWHILRGSRGRTRPLK